MMLFWLSIWLIAVGSLMAAYNLGRSDAYREAQQRLLGLARITAQQMRELGASDADVKPLEDMARGDSNGR
ncbi:MAG: hypothetical protein NW206_19725 [Hyphomonadaceae bacterium]|nr:hypothetical protein [Hyphomonadaceae bacterium]